MWDFIITLGRFFFGIGFAMLLFRGWLYLFVRSFPKDDTEPRIQ